MARFKYERNLQSLARCVGSTCHDGLLVPGVWELPWRAPRGVGHPETHPHTRGAVGYAEYSSRTLAPGLQLCKECNYSSLWRSVFCWPTYVPVYHPRFEPLLDRSSEVWACVHLFQEGRLIDAVKRPNTFIPLSTTHRETTGQKSRSPTLAIRSAVAVLCCSRPARARPVWAIALSPTVTPWSCGFRRRPPIWSRHRPRLHPWLNFPRMPSPSFSL